MMLNIRKILIPTDLSNESNKAIDTANVLAKPLYAHLEVLYTVPFSIYHTTEDYADNEYYEFVGLEAEMKLSEYVRKNAMESPISYSVKKGQVLENIIKTVDEHDIDLLVVKYLAKAQFQKDTKILDIVRKVNCPTLAIPTTCSKKSIEKIILPIRNNPDTMEKVRFTIGLAVLQHAAIHLVIFYPSLMESKANESMTSLVKEVYDLLEKSKIKVSYTYIMGGNYTIDTISTAAKQNGDLIVISHYQSNFLKRIMGLAEDEKFLKRSTIPILIMPFNPSNKRKVNTELSKVSVSS